MTQEREQERVRRETEARARAQDEVRGADHAVEERTRAEAERIAEREDVTVQEAQAALIAAEKAHPLLEDEDPDERALHERLDRVGDIADQGGVDRQSGNPTTSDPKDVQKVRAEADAELEGKARGKFEAGRPAGTRMSEETAAAEREKQAGGQTQAQAKDQVAQDQQAARNQTTVQQTEAEKLAKADRQARAEAQAKAEADKPKPTTAKPTTP